MRSYLLYRLTSVIFSVFISVASEMTDLSETRNTETDSSVDVYKCYILLLIKSLIGSITGPRSAVIALGPVTSLVVILTNPLS